MHQAVVFWHWSQKSASNEQVDQVRVFALMAQQGYVSLVDAVLTRQ